MVAQSVSGKRPGGGPSGLVARLGERWHAWRARTVADPAFQRFAIRFPLTRPIARRRSRELFDLVAGFTYTQTLFACVEIELFEHLARGPADVETLARRTGLPVSGMERLLAAATALKLVSRRPVDRYALADLGASMRANPGVTAMVRHHALLYRDLADPLRLLRDPSAPTELSAFCSYVRDDRDGLGADDVTDYSALMAASQGFIASEVLEAYPFHRHRRLLDIGGGTGAVVVAAAERLPDISFELFDLPAVAEQASARFIAENIAHRARATGGDLFADPLPQGADIACLIRVLYDHDTEAVRRILAAARSALAPGGTLIVAEPMADTPGAEPMGAAYFGFYLLAMKGGLPRTAAEISMLLKEAGFAHVDQARTKNPLLTSVLVARP